MTHIISIHIITGEAGQPPSIQFVLSEGVTPDMGADACAAVRRELEIRAREAYAKAQVELALADKADTDKEASDGAD